jgi:superfamily I DNA/RNA helicase
MSASLATSPLPRSAGDVLALSPEQRAARSSRSGLTVISAGAGTGKTTTLLARLTWLIEEGIRPESLVVTTFTRQACRDMRKRLSLAHPEAEEVKIQTMHSLAAKILRTYSARASAGWNHYSIIDKADGLVVMKEILSKYATKNKFSAENILSRLHRKKEACGRVDWSGVSDGNKNEILDIFATYEERLHSQRLIELADIIPMAVKVMAKPEMASRLAHIKHILVDEWQDTNPAQIEMVRRITALGASATVVGDDDQSIYSFRGTAPRLVERADEVLPEVALRGCSRFALTQNRRSTQNILVPAVKMVNHNCRDKPKILVSQTSGPAIAVLLYKSDKKEAQFVCQRIKDMTMSGLKPGDISVLARTRSALSSVMEKMTENGVPFCATSITPLYERRWAKDILAYIRLAISPKADVPFTRIAAKPKRGLGPAAVAAITSIAKNGQVSIHEALSLYAGGKAAPKARDGALRLACHLNELAEAIDNNESSADILDYILSETGYEAWAREFDRDKGLDESISMLRELCAENSNVFALMDAVMTSSDSGSANPNAVYVGTLHSAKGMEWPHVFLVGMEQGVLPHASAIDAGRDAVEEERRLAHVGMTRAKETLTITCAKMREMMGSPHFMKPSRFIAEAGLAVQAVE